MEIRPAALELYTKNFDEVPPLKVGDLISVRIMEIKDRTVMLLIDNSIQIKTRLDRDLKLQPGQDMVLQVKSIKPDRIELSIAFVKNGRQNIFREIFPEYGMKADEESVSTAEKLIENGLPVSPDSIREVLKAEKSIRYLAENSSILKEYMIPKNLSIKETTLDEIVKWIVDVKKAPAHKNQDSARESVEREKLGLLIREFDRVTTDDIVKLKKFSPDISPHNLVLAKNMRENKGFLETLLKILFENARLERTEKNEYNKAAPRTKQESAVQNGHKDGATGAREYGNEIKPVNVSELIERAAAGERAEGLVKSTDSKGPNPVIKAAAQLLMERTALLDQAFLDQNCCVFPFIFRGEVYECIVGFGKRKGSPKEKQPDAVELDIDTHLSILGRVRIHVKVSGNNVTCVFHVQKEDTQRLVESEIERLKHGLENNGFRLTEAYCRKIPDTVQQPAEKFVDLRV